MREEAASATGLVTLPIGYKDPDGEFHAEMVVKEMTGKEQDLLMARSIEPNMKIMQLLMNCTSRLGSIDAEESPAKLAKALKGLTNADRIWALIEIRCLTYGSDFSFEIKCPECGAKSKRTVDLLSVKRELPEMKGEPVDPRDYPFKMTTSRGTEVEWTYLTWDAEQALGFLARERAADDPAVDRMRATFGLWARLCSLGGHSFERKFITDGSGKPRMSATERDLIQGLGMRERREIQGHIDGIEGAVLDLEIRFSCEEGKCRCKETMPLEVIDAGFFFPEV